MRMMRERFGPMLARGATTLWESFEPSASLCHGFSASPTYQLSRRVLGVVPLEAGFAAVDFAPDLADLDFARGVYPTIRGDIEVELERNAGGFEGRGPAPKDTRVKVSGSRGLTLRPPTKRYSGKLQAQYAPAIPG